MTYDVPTLLGILVPLALYLLCVAAYAWIEHCIMAGVVRSLRPGDLLMAAMDGEPGWHGGPIIPPPRPGVTVPGPPAIAPKPWWTSRGVVGPLVAGLAVVVTAITGVEIDGATQAVVVDQVVAIVGAVTVLAGAVVGIIGRIRASRPIGR